MAWATRLTDSNEGPGADINILSQFLLLGGLYGLTLDSLNLSVNECDMISHALSLSNSSTIILSIYCCRRRLLHFSPRSPVPVTRPTERYGTEEGLARSAAKKKAEQVAKKSGH